MERIPFQLEQSLVDNPPKIFGDVKYLIEGNVDPKIIKLLDNGGAKKLSYAGLSATHMIAGEGADEVKLAEAEDVFEFPVVQPRWVAFSAKAGKLLTTAGFECQSSKRLFSSFRVTASGLNPSDLKILWANLTHYGGVYQSHLSTSTTHLVTNQTTSKKYAKSIEKGIKIVCCDWITECIKSNSILDEAKYHPKLLGPLQAKDAPILVKINQSKSEAVTPTPTSKAASASQSKQSQKVSQAATNTTAVRQQMTQGQTILQVQLAGSQHTNGPRGRGVAVRQQAPQILLQPKQQAGTTNVRAHRPLLVSTPQQQAQKSKAVPPPSQPPPPPVTVPQPQTKPGPQQAPQQQQIQLPSMQQHQQQAQVPPGQQQQAQLGQQQQPQGAPGQQQQQNQMVPVQQQQNQPPSLQQKQPNQPQQPVQQQQPNQLQMALQQTHIQQQQPQQQQPNQGQMPTQQSNQIPGNNQQQQQQLQLTSMQQQIPMSMQSAQLSGQLPPQQQQQQHQNQLVVSQQQQPQVQNSQPQQQHSIQLQQQLQSQQQMNSMQQQQQQQQMHHPSQLHQQLQGQLHIQQQQQLQIQQSNQLQTALSQQSQAPPTLPTQVQVITHPQQGGMQLHLQPHQIVSQSQQQSVLQNQLQQIQHSVMQHQSQQIQHLQQQQQQQQHNVQHQQLGHPQNQPGMQQGHQILQQQQPQQGMQIQRPPSQQGHPMHLQQQMQNQMGQPHQGVQISGMQFSQHNQQQLLQQQQHQHQLQIQQQQHNLQHMQPNLSNQQQQGNLQSQPQQVLQPQKSPLPITTQPMQTVQGQPQQSLHIQQSMPINQQSGIQLGISPLQGLQQQQAYQIQSQQQQQQNQQLLQQQQQQQQQQFISPVPSKTPPQQLHPQSPQHQQIMQAQGGMRPPSQPGQQQSVQFQILQPQNRLQVVMGIPQQPQQYQQQQPQQNPQGASNIIANQQQVFRQQQPHPQQGVVSQGIKPQGQLYHSLQQQQQQQQQRPQGMMQIQQQPQQGPGGHSIQVMQGGQPGHPPTSHSQTGVSQLQPILSPQQLNKFQEIGPSSGQQLQQGGQHYNVVIHQGQQYAQMNPPPPRPQQQPRHPGKPGSLPNQPQLGQRVGPIQHGGQPRPGAHQWAQHTEIIRQFQNQMDPVFKAKFSQMDPQQQQLFIQKYIQRSREEQLRKEMMLRQQQLNQQNAAMQGQSPGQGMAQPQQGVPGSPQHLTGQPQSQTILVQQGVPQASQSPGGDKPMGMQSQQGSPALVPQPTQSPLSQSASPQLPQGVQQGQIPGSPGVNPGANQQQQQQILMQNQLLAQQQNQQKMLNPRAQSPTQKFPPPSPIQPMQTRSPTHPGIPGQQPQASGTIVRTQQVFTPQVAQHGQQQPRMVLVQQGGVQNQQARFPQHQIILQQHQQAIPGQGQPQQKVAILQQPHQSPNQPGQSSGQWMPGTSQPQRLGSPTQSTTQFPPRMQSPDAQQRSPGQVWNVRAQPGSLITPGSPGTPNAAPYVQVVNSKTKTALANLLNNRLQGNSTGIDSSTTTSTGSSMVTPSTSTTLTMCPSSQNLPVSSSQSQQLPLQHPVTQPSSQTLNVVNQRRTLSNLTNSCKTIHQVNSYGTAAVRAGSLSQSPTSVAIPSTRIPFYGYEPNFKPPQNGFLIGCVFWPAQLMDDPNWRRTIILFGGEILNEYNAMKVTHVLCNNQKFPEFQQVLRDGKRLVTLHWLSDTCCRKVMAPPFFAMHLPTPFNEDNLPLKGQPFSTTGFDVEDRERVVKMLKLLGAECTPYFTKLNKGLVAFRSEGAKFTKAREWKLPVINIQFLNELLLGNSSCLQMIHSPKYQHFTLEQPFRFDININPNLMAAWKTPIRVSGDILDKFKTGKRPLENPNEDGGERSKRIKLIDDEKTQLSYLTEQASGTELVKQENDSKNDIENKRPPVVMFTGFSEKFKTLAKEQVVALGGRVTSEVKEATHLVCWEVVTSKLYSALCRVKYIVGAPWIRDSVKAKRFVDEMTYISCVENFEKHHKVTIAEVLKKPDRHLLFKGMTFFITPGIVGKTRSDLEKIIESGGGQPDKLQKSMTDVRLKARKNPRKYIVITSPEDFEMFSDFFYYKPSKPLSVFTTHFLYKSIADQKVDFGPLPSKKATQKVGPANSA